MVFVQHKDMIGHKLYLIEDYKLMEDMFIDLYLKNNLVYSIVVDKSELENVFKSNKLVTTYLDESDAMNSKY